MRIKSYRLNRVANKINLFAFISDKLTPSFLFRPNLKDENDNVFIELAVVSHSQYLITNNLKDYRNSELKFDCFKVLTPSDFLENWRKQYREN